MSNTYFDDEIGNLDDIRKSIDEVKKIVSDISTDKAYCWSIDRVEDISYLEKNRRHVLGVGWVEDLDATAMNPIEVNRHIKERHGPGKYRVTAVSENGRKLSEREIVIPVAAWQGNSDIETFNFKPYMADRLVPHACSLTLQAKNKRLAFPKEKSRRALFLGQTRRPFRGTAKVTFPVEGMDDGGRVTFVVVLQGRRANGNIVSFRELVEHDPGADLTTVRVSYDIVEDLHDFRIVIMRNPDAVTDVNMSEVLVGDVHVAFHHEVSRRKYVSEDTADIGFLIANNLVEDYRESYEDVQGLVNACVNRFQRDAVLKIKGGFVDLGLLAEDLGVDEGIIAVIAREYIRSMPASLGEKFEIKQVDCMEFGMVTILRRKRTRDGWFS